MLKRKKAYSLFLSLLFFFISFPPGSTAGVNAAGENLLSIPYFDSGIASSREDLNTDDFRLSPQVTSSGSNVKVMFLGNSITKHGVAESLGWYNNWGMAATTEANDYVHRLMDYYAAAKYGAMEFQTYTIGGFERSIVAQDNYDYTDVLQPVMSSVSSFAPNLIVLQMGENVNVFGITSNQYANALNQMINGFKSINPNIKVILCKPFWYSEAKANGVESVSNSTGFLYADLSPLNIPANLAPYYSNPGVAAHPGDLGHDAIAQALWSKMDLIISGIIPAIPPSSVTIQSVSDTITIEGGTLQLFAEVLPADAEDKRVIWSVNDENLATINSDGLLAAKNNGSVTVTATAAAKSTVFATKIITISGQSMPFTVTYAAGTTDTVTGLPEPDNFAKGNFVLSTQKPQRAYYKFVGWSTTVNGNVVTQIQVTGNVTVYAVWSLLFDWNFDTDGDLENWVIEDGFNTQVSNGKLMSMATGTDISAGNQLKFVSPALNLDTNIYKKLVINMSNTAFLSGSNVDLYVTTTAGTKHYTSPITSTGYTLYTFDLSDSTGTITGFYFYPTVVDCSVSIEYAGFFANDTAEGYTSIKDWNFNTDGNLEGWTMANSSAIVSGGALHLTANGIDPLIWSPNDLAITAPATYSKVCIRMKNNSPKTSAKIYFITNSDQNWNEVKAKAFTITANSGYTDYVVDMSTVSGWTGTIKQIRVDPLDPAVSGQTVDIDYIRVTNGGEEMVNDNFNGMTTGSAPTGYTLDTTGGTVTVEDVPGSEDKSVKIFKSGTENNAFMTKNFTSASGTVTVEARVQAGDSASWKYALYVGDNTGSWVASIVFSTDSLMINNNGGGDFTTVQAYTAGTWYDLKLVLNTTTDKFDLYVNNVLTNAQVTFRTGTDNITKVTFGIAGAFNGTLYVDNVKVNN